MKTLFLTTVAALALSGAANATDFACGAPQFSVGRQSVDPQDTVNRVEIRHGSNSPEWLVHHRFVNGSMVMRQEQYAMIDTSRNGYWSWRGQLRKNGVITMVGELGRDYQGVFYRETQYANGRVIMQTRSACQVAALTPPPAPPQPPIVQAPPSPPVVQAPPPPPSAPQQQPPVIIVMPPPASPPVVVQPPEPKPPIVVTPPAEPKPERIPVNIQNNAVTLNVGLGNQTVSMILDTGATHSSVSNDVADLLVSKGQARWDGQARVTVADGSSKLRQVIRIYEVKIGSHVVRNVEASVNDGLMLLGFSVLKAIGSFTIDTRNNELVFTTVEAKNETNTQTDAPPPPVTTPSSSKEFWPEGTGLSNDCGREIAQHQDANGRVPADLETKLSPKCQDNLKRWGEQLKKNLDNPAFVRHITDVFDGERK